MKVTRKAVMVLLVLIVLPAIFLVIEKYIVGNVRSGHPKNILSSELNQNLKKQIQQNVDRLLRPTMNLLTKFSLEDYMDSCTATENYVDIYSRVRKGDSFGPYAIGNTIKEIDLLCRSDGLKFCEKNMKIEQPPCNIDAGVLGIIQAHFSASPNTLACRVALKYYRLPETEMDRACRFLEAAILRSDPKFCSAYKRESDFCPQLETVILGPKACPPQMDLDPRPCMPWALAYKAFKLGKVDHCQGHPICLAAFAHPSICGGDSAPEMVKLGKRVVKAYCARKWKLKFRPWESGGGEETLKIAEVNFEQFAQQLILRQKHKLMSDPGIEELLSIEQVKDHLDKARIYLGIEMKNYRDSIPEMRKRYEKEYGLYEVWNSTWGHYERGLGLSL